MSGLGREIERGLARLDQITKPQVTRMATVVTRSRTRNLGRFEPRAIVLTGNRLAEYVNGVAARLARNNQAATSRIFAPCQRPVFTTALFDKPLAIWNIATAVPLALHPVAIGLLRSNSGR